MRPEARSISQILDVAQIELQRMRQVSESRAMFGLVSPNSLIQQDQGTLDPQQRDLDYGPDNGFLPLDGQCFSKTIQVGILRPC